MSDMWTTSWDMSYGNAGPVRLFRMFKMIGPQAANFLLPRKNTQKGSVMGDKTLPWGQKRFERDIEISVN